MPDEPANNSRSPVEPSSVAVPPETRAGSVSAAARVPATPREWRPARKRRKRWSWKRWVANLMIIGGIVMLPAYFLGTCGYTWLQQRGLRQDLENANPQMAAADAAFAANGFVSATVSTVTTLDPAAAREEVAAADAAIAAAKAEHDRQLAAFRAAGDAYAALVGGQTGEPLGKILIPSIGVDVIMVEGTSVGDLKEGPGHWAETPFPGQGGNFVVSGHRTTYGAPFFKLNEVEVGDEIDLVLPYAAVRYTVSRVFIVYPDEVDSVAQRGREQISLAACHPIYSAQQRIVVQGELTSFKLVESEGS
jgi:LPXTG-site transpeptidase (sortase) family protein